MVEEGLGFRVQVEAFGSGSRSHGSAAQKGDCEIVGPLVP